MLGPLFILFIFLFGMARASFSQGCIVYKKEKDGIFVGADVRSVTYSAHGATSQMETNYNNVCKIGNVNNIHFAVTGHAADIGLDEARKACNNKITFSDVVRIYAETFGQRLADILEADRRTMRETYSKNFPAGTVVGGSVFFFYENGTLIGRVIKITLVSKPTEKATISTRNENMDSIGVAGSTTGIGNVVFHKDIWKKGAVKGITNLIEIEKMANPNGVAGVVDILFVSNKNEEEWIQRRKCE
jgi:hypothetical protein